MEVAATKAFLGSVFELTVKQAVHRLVFDPYIQNPIATIAIDAPTFRVPVTIFLKNYVEEYSYEQGKIEHSYQAKVTAVDNLHPVIGKELKQVAQPSDGLLRCTKNRPYGV